MEKYKRIGINERNKEIKEIKEKDRFPTILRGFTEESFSPETTKTFTAAGAKKPH